MTGDPTHTIKSPASPAGLNAHPLTTPALNMASPRFTGDVAWEDARAQFRTEQTHPPGPDRENILPKSVATNLMYGALSGNGPSP